MYLLCLQEFAVCVIWDLRYYQILNIIRGIKHETQVLVFFLNPYRAFVLIYNLSLQTCGQLFVFELFNEKQIKLQLFVIILIRHNLRLLT